MRRTERHAHAEPWAWHTILDPSNCQCHPKPPSCREPCARQARERNRWHAESMIGPRTDMHEALVPVGLQRRRCEARWAAKGGVFDAWNAFCPADSLFRI